MRPARLKIVCWPLLVAAGLAIADPSSLAAQVAAGEITGRVNDQAGAAVPGATITVTATATNRQRIVTSTLAQKQDLAAIIHLCGAGPGDGYARRGFTDEDIVSHGIECFEALYHSLQD